MELCQCVAGKVHQRRRAEVLGVAHHPEVGHGYSKQNQSRDPGCLRGGAVQAEGQQQDRTRALHFENPSP